MNLMRKIYFLLTLCCALLACKKNNVDFTYSPESPRAGETVLFSNQSDTGEEWEWSFGDGSKSTIKSPSHVYKAPGDYVVTLKVDNKSSWTRTAKITVYDTVPTFVASDSLFYIFRDYTFTANLYNPYNYTVAYQWIFPQGSEYFVPTVGLNGSSITGYFTKPMQEASVSLLLVLNGDSLLIEKIFHVRDTVTHSLLIRTNTVDYRQRLFGDRAEQYKADASAKTWLDLEQDTLQVYNGAEFRLSVLKTVFPQLQGFHIANRKIYYRADGLWVAHIDGSDAVQIDPLDCSAMTLDTQDSRIYWANAQGIWYMPFVGSDNNRFVTDFVQLNDLTGVTKLAVDYEPR